MVANLTTPLIGIVSTIAIGRLGDATQLGGVAIASVIFDCLFWLFAFLRMSTVAFTAQSLGSGETSELRAILLRGLIVAALVGAVLIALQIPLATILLGAMGSLALAYRISERDYPENPGPPTVPWVCVTVALASAALWILSQPMEMRGGGLLG